MDTTEQIARTLNKVDKQRNPTWGGADEWEQLRDYQREDYLAMAAAIKDAGWIDGVGLKARLKAFARDCVTHGDMTPGAARMLDRIADELETAWAAAT